MLSVIIFMYSKVLPHKRPYILRGGKRMLREIRSWQEGKTIFSHVKYVGRDFYGPMLDLIIIHEEDLMPVVEVIASSYKFEDATIADGINVTVEKAAKEASEKAFAEGEQSMMINQIIKKVKKSKTLETIASELEEEVADIKPIYDVVIAAAPDYNIDIIKNKLAIN